LQPLLDLPHARARTLLSSGAPVYLSINPVEYHGPHLSLHNDGLVSLGFIQELHQALQRTQPDWPLLFGGSLDTGLDPVPGPGSRPLPWAVGHRACWQACQALLQLGAQRVVLMTFHGSPLHNAMLNSCAQRLKKRGVACMLPGNLLFANLLSPPLDELAPTFAHIEDEGERQAMLQGLNRDFHAGFLETSISLHYVPQTVGDYQQLPPCPPTAPAPGFLALSRLARRLGRQQLARELRFVAQAAPWYRLRPFPGYTGRPHRAAARAGAAAMRVLVRQVADCALQVFDGRGACPGPVLSWVPKLTLYGRVGPKKG